MLCDYLHTHCACEKLRFFNQCSHKSSLSRTEVEFFSTLLPQTMMTIKDQSGLHKAAFIPFTQQWTSWKQHYKAMLGYFWGSGGALRKYILLPRVLVLLSKKHNGVVKTGHFYQAFACTEKSYQLNPKLFLNWFWLHKCLSKSNLN